MNSQSELFALLDTDSCLDAGHGHAHKDNAIRGTHNTNITLTK